MGESGPSMTMSPAFTLSDFDFALPPELIAQHPAAERSASRLLDGAAPSRVRPHVPRPARRCCAPATCWSFNDTAVIKARLFGEKASGGAVEALVERVDGRRRRVAHMRASKSPQAGHASLRFADGLRCRGARPRPAATGRCSGCAFRDDPLRAARAPRPRAAAALHRARRRRRTTCERYQTVFAARPGRGRGADGGAALRRRAAGGARRARRRARQRHAARRRRHVPAGAQREPRRAPHAQRVVRGRRRRGRARSRARARAAAASSPSARPACARSSRRRCARGGRRPARARPTSSSRRAFASASSTCSSPTSTCPRARC